MLYNLAHQRNPYIMPIDMPSFVLYYFFVMPGEHAVINYRHRLSQQYESS